MKITTLNLHNFFLDPQVPSQGRGVKPPEKIETIERALQKIDPDIILCQEVGGESSLRIFSETYLNKEFQHSVIKGNSDRGIEIGFLIKKRLPYRFEHYTHKNRDINFFYPHEREENKKAIDSGNDPIHPSHRFSRDVAELRIYKGDQLALIVLQVHLKSKKDRNGFDPQGVGKRTAELNTLVKLYSRMKDQFQVPIVIGGDFNGVVSRDRGDRELSPILDTDLKDILELIDSPNGTHIHFGSNRQKVELQFDYLFLSHELHSKVDHSQSGITYYVNNQGVTMDPTRPYELYSMPSDHFPLTASFEI